MLLYHCKNHSILFVIFHAFRILFSCDYHWERSQACFCVLFSMRIKIMVFNSNPSLLQHLNHCCIHKSHGVLSFWKKKRIINTIFVFYLMQCSNPYMYKYPNFSWTYHYTLTSCIPIKINGRKESRNTQILLLGSFLCVQATCISENKTH